MTGSPLREATGEIPGQPLVSSLPDFAGDLLVLFGSAGDPDSTRPGSRSWESVAETEAWRLWIHPGGTGWKGSPLIAVANGPWRAWLLGELYGPPHDPVRVVRDLLEEPRLAARLSGHFLLLAWNETGRQWHTWTDRFGTFHLYHAAQGDRAAIGTFFPTVARAASRRRLDWLGLAGFFSFGFFPQARTHFEDVRILRPATHSVFHQRGHLLREERYWDWSYEPDRKRDSSETLAEFARLLGDVMADLTRAGRIAIPISGGLDSRSTVAALSEAGRAPAHASRLWSYSYGYGDSVETHIARRIAAARALRFQAFTIQPYLAERLGWVLSCTEGFQDVTQCRQAAVADELSAHADYVIAAHWGDVWLDDVGFKGTDPPAEQIVISHTIQKIEKRGGSWLLERLCAPQLKSQEPRSLLRELVSEELKRLAGIGEPEFRIKAFKTDQWSFRWTTSSLRMFQAAVFPRLPFYDTRLTDFFATVPSTRMGRRRLQIDYLKRFAPDLARITWQAYDADLFHYQHFHTWLLPKRAVKKTWRLLSGRNVIERNWEVQLFNEAGRRLLERSLLHPGLRLREFLSAEQARKLLDDFFVAPLEEGRGYTVSMLLTFSAWLEQFG